MPKLKDQQDADRQFDPYSNPSARDLYRQEQETGDDASVNAGIDQAESFANDPKNASRNIDEARNREETPNTFNYQSSDKEAGTPQKFNFKGALKKKGPLGLLIGILFGGVGGLGFLISPGMAIVQLKEVLTDDLNDQLAAMDIRTTHVFKAKLNDMGKGVCRGVKIKCGYKGFSDRQLKRFQAAGVEVETDGKTTFGRHKVTALVFKEKVGFETREIRVTNPAKLNKLLGERMVRDSLRRAFNPKFAGFQDAVSAKVFQRFKTNKGDKIGTSGSVDEMDDSIDSAVEGDPINADAQLRNTTDPDGNKIEGSDEQNSQIERQSESVSDGGESTSSLFSSAAKSGVKSAAKGVLITGAADTACTVKNTARAVEAAAKIYRMRQLIRFAMVYLSFADEIKAGTATPEKAEYIGNKLTAVDTEKAVVNETSAFSVSNDEPKEVDNPDYGKNAFDSDGYKIAQYNDAPTLSARTMQYTIGGGAVMGTLSTINDYIQKYAGGNKCKYIQNAGVRIGSFIVGVFAGVVTFGTSFFVQAGLSVAIGLALPILENYLAQIVAGNVVNSDTDGVDAGNAIFAGSAGLMGNMAMDRGMKPASKDDLKSYLAVNQKVQNEYIAMETEDAKKTPFDVYNRYSFMGSLVRTLLPLRTSSAVSVGNSFANVFGILPIASSLTSSTTHAQNEYNEDRFSKCKDYGYEELGIDADVFCNVRYVLSDYELGLDSDDVIDWMASHGYINSDDGSPQDEYADWLKECTERTSGWGETPEGQENGGEGEQCRKDDKKTSYFRVYTMDRSIFEAMDYEPPVTSGAALSGGSNFRIASFNVLGKSHTDGAGADKPSFSTWSQRIEYSLETIKTNNLEIIAFQEFEPDQRAYLKEHLPNYGQSNHGKESDSIMWNTDRFDLVDKGTWETVYFGGPIHEPWVKLKDKDTEQEFYVLSVHDPINRGQGNAQTRYENALKHKALIERLQPNAPVLLVGDFNSAYTKDGGSGAASNEKLTYCVLAVNGPVNDAYDLSVPRQEKCPNKPKQGVRNYIDHIYLTPEIEVSSFKEIRSGNTSNGSDHPTIFSDVVIPGAASNGAGTDFVIGTYNQPTRGNAQAAATKIVENKMDVVGMQELAGSNYFTLKSSLGNNGYKVYPDIKKGENRSGHCSSGRAIFYNTSKFKLVKSEITDIPSYETTKFSSSYPPYVNPVNCGNGEMTRGGGRANIPIIWLQDVGTGQTVIVMNTHNLANCCGSAGVASKKRYQAISVYINKIRDLTASNPGIPIFFSGDFNEGTGVRYSGNVTYQHNHNNLLYCMFNENKLMIKALGSRDQACKTDREGMGQVDFVYTTPGVKVEWAKEFRDPSTNDAPHPVHFGKVIVPGSKDSSQRGSDVIGDDYARECGKYLNAGDCTGECVGFVKFRLVKHGVINPLPLGNGGAVVSTLGRLGFKVNDTPAVHSVFSMPTSSVGHTGIVSAVKSDGSIVIEEYNWPGGHKYNTRTLTPAQYKAAGMRFAHTETKYK